ncbi:MAG: DUF523 domain-containing protein [Deltaproteobacteria bacterium]|nr:DUF523 domain-containing protein [Deltaproteobacteria bacterium]
MVIVSACLLGIKCRYDGSSRILKGIMDCPARHSLLPLCPEQLGGLPTPRFPCEIIGGDGKDVLEGKACVCDAHGGDMTEKFIRGAEEAARLARLFNVEYILLKERSPSCGVRYIIRKGRPAAGMGVTAALLTKEGIPVRSSEDFHEDWL